MLKVKLCKTLKFPIRVLRAYVVAYRPEVHFISIAHESTEYIYIYMLKYEFYPARYELLSS